MPVHFTVPVMHLSIDGSKKKAKRFALRASFWDVSMHRPVTSLLAAFILFREKAEDFEGAIVDALARCETNLGS